ncbi:MAG: phenylalanine--tRNA ligase subunit alpha [Candidatus Diapherotrites archaeon]|uniref:phenylalanine--tRNA ligase n=1 Tax=Candidatus Iainarchaeum sp. TaxID=3101447 RepID=A0A8T4C605_9ARCH|nr:phenylalanine--tRNA ligase subunit alpha [Candidatus Diapherotrites archaeon]
MSDPALLLLSVLRDGKEHSLSSIAESASLSPDAVRRVLGDLSEKSLVVVSREKKEKWFVSKSGEDALSSNGLPEQLLCHVLRDNALDMNALRGHFSTNPQAFSAAFGLAKRSNWITLESKNNQTLIRLTDAGKKSADHSPLFHVLQAVSRGEDIHAHSNVITELSARGLIQSKTHTVERVRITPEGLSLLDSGKIPSSTAQIGVLTPQLLQSGSWKNASFKPYDVTLGVEERWPGRIHPLRNVMRDVRQIMVELGFDEMSSGLVESAFWNMDAMFIPQDHPAREVQDTFYLPGRAVLDNPDLVKRVKALHEHGGKTGSKGFGYEWDPRVAAQLLLRTHTTATTFREFALHPQQPQKKFAIGRIFRNEAIDATHLAEFHQVEGFVMGEGLNLRHLMGIIREFYAKLGFTKVRFKPTYNPYTEPSMESAAYNPQLGKWVEIINSGMFRKESLSPFGIDVPVIAWGFGLERIVMMLYEKNTIKEIMGPDVDVDFIRSYSGVKHGLVKKEEFSHGKR